MINNRQNGRRRGRGGQQARNGQPGTPDRGNRLDNRARGNAAQLLEKYKTLARDAQMQGDRVNTEYYLQFADHYFRVLSESRARFDEQRPRQSNESRDEYGDDDNDGQQGDQGGDDWDDDQPQVEQQRNYAPRQERSASPNEGNRNDSNRSDNGRGDGNRNDSNRNERNDTNRGDGNRDGGQRDAGGRDNGNRDSNNRDAGPREQVSREPVSRDNREPVAREGGNREEARPPRRRSNAASNANAASNGTNGNGGDNGFTAPDFLNAPISPRFDLDRAPAVEAPQAADAGAEPTEAAPKPRRTRRPRGEAAPVEA